VLSLFAHFKKFSTKIKLRRDSYIFKSYNRHLRASRRHNGE